ncbi:hypothetical protein [Microbacterium sp. RU33B]|uniref:hypothetical protein n=1 Tax=Microbacterium sp. RU33B TaxID=1907390 RepID=UPI001C4D1C40|nr:hypothetical protein [Microbacterium sp. RU33B]
MLLAASTSTTPVGVTLKMDGNLTNVSGSASVRAQTVSAAGGKIVLQSRPGNGDAAVYPSVGSETGAVLAVTNATGTDVLAPGTRDFSFGADFRTVSGGKNDGDNLIQRGLADDSGQYKIELDSGSAVCVVKGSRKTATVRIGHVIAPNVWYRVNCSRTGSEIALTLTRIDSGAEWRSRTNSVVGSVATKSVGTPLTVGGKLTPKLAIAAWEPDQFNGTIDNAFMRVNR